MLRSYANPLHSSAILLLANAEDKAVSTSTGADATVHYLSTCLATAAHHVPSGYNTPPPTT
ncbi:hypothetical protein H920_18870 [Fukomys damarensis]|uniref:Uncharacterized protein n=1 Tax=Fukomys damarensis TaxID=885580 RepID=A0A091CNY0_FUKDA|nr:hypothetical protein H920_18870 [Fukomys damarensis]